MRERTLISLVIIILLTLISGYLAAPIEKPQAIRDLAFWQDARGRDLQIKQGLDLKGGLQVLLTSGLGAGEAVTSTMETARTIIEGRVNSLGVSEANVQLQGSERILVELPGVSDRKQAIDLIQQTGSLEFADGSAFGGGGIPPEGFPVTTTFMAYRGLQYPQTSAIGKPIVPVSETTLLPTAFTGEILQSDAQPETSTGRFVVRFNIKLQAQQAFGEFTGKSVGRPLCLVLDGKILSCPTIQSQLTSGGVIQGNFNFETARNLAVTLNYGALPVPLKIETVRDVGATLGIDSVRRSVTAGLIGLAVLALFLILYYRLPGLISAGALLFFALFSLAIIVLIPITLTLPGVAGFLLSVATAVDANILVLERFKEELRSGRTLRASVESAFSRAWTSVRDSNISTLITCIILFMFGGVFGASAVKGFAINLIIGILISLFTTMFVTRTLMRLSFSQASTELRENKALLGA